MMILNLAKMMTSGTHHWRHDKTRQDTDDDDDDDGKLMVWRLRRNRNIYIHTTNGLMRNSCGIWR